MAPRQEAWPRRRGCGGPCRRNGLRGWGGEQAWSRPCLPLWGRCHGEAVTDEVTSSPAPRELPQRGSQVPPPPPSGQSLPPLGVGLGLDCHTEGEARVYPLKRSPPAPSKRSPTLSVLPLSWCGLHFSTSHTVESVGILSLSANPCRNPLSTIPSATPQLSYRPPRVCLSFRADGV